MKIKITKSKLKEIVKEEAVKFKRVLELKKELDKIEQQLNEVKAGSPIENGSDGVHAGQRKAVFSTKNGNPHLKMEDDIEDIESDDEILGDEEIAGAEDVVAVAGDEVSDEMGDDIGSDTVSKSEVKDAIEDLETRLGLNGETPEGEEGEEEFEFDTDTEEVPAGEEDVEGEEEIAEYGDEHQVATTDAVEQSAEKEEDAVTENLDEPIEGVSVAQAAKDSTVDDGMEKDKHVKEGEEKEEVKETIAEAEKKRMALLAGIIKG